MEGSLPRSPYKRRPYMNGYLYGASVILETRFKGWGLWKVQRGQAGTGTDTFGMVSSDFRSVRLSLGFTHTGSSQPCATLCRWGVFLLQLSHHSMGIVWAAEESTSCECESEKPCSQIKCSGSVQPLPHHSRHRLKKFRPSFC